MVPERIPVSYTHLDVYKRQRLDQEISRMNRDSAKAPIEELRGKEKMCIRDRYTPIGAMGMEEVDRNTDVLLSFMDRASGGFPGFDLFVAPEACIQGFPQFGWEKALLTMDSPQIKKFQEKCAELEVYGVFDFLLRVDEQNDFTNTAIVINDKGEILSLIHIFMTVFR